MTLPRSIMLRKDGPEEMADVHANLVAMMHRARCTECGRVFDLSDETDAEEWAYGHDCEV